jgi:hypothetical protein
VFKTPGKLRGKTPRTARKKTFEVRQVRMHHGLPASSTDTRQPLANLFAADIQQQRTSPAEQRLRDALQLNSAKFDFHIAEDAENVAPTQSPAAPSPVTRQLFSKAQATSPENADISFHTNGFDERQARQLSTSWSHVQSTQDTVMSSQADAVFSPPRTQTTQATQSFRHSINEELDEDEEEVEKEQKLVRRDTGDSFVSANEAFANKSISKENMPPQNQEDIMELDDDDQEDDDQEDDARSNGTVVHHELDFADEDDDMDHVSVFPQPPRVVSEPYGMQNETPEAMESANWRSIGPESRMRFEPSEFDFSTTPSGPPPASPDLIQHDDTIVHDDVEDEEMDAEEPSEHSSPVKPLVRKSSLTFASLPAREPLLAKKSMGHRVSRTSHVDPSRARSSHMGRFTGGKSLGGSQFMQPSDVHDDDDSDADEKRPLPREESESAKVHTMTTTQRLHERINMMKQLNEAPKPVSHFVSSSQSSQPQSFAAPSKEDTHFSQLSQPSYPILPVASEPGREDDDDDDWISPIRTAPPVANFARPALANVFSSDAHVSPAKPKPAPIKLVSSNNPDLSAAAETTTPAGSPAGRKYADGPLSASKAKFYSALRAAKDKMTGTSAAAAQTKLDALSSSPARPRSQVQLEELFNSPKRTERPISLFSHMRTPSKDSIKSVKSTLSLKLARGAEVPSSPAKEGSRRTRSSTEREKQSQSDREKEMKQKQRVEERLKEMREKEQSKAAAHHQKIKKAPGEMSSQSSLKSAASVMATVRTPTAAPQQTLPRPGALRQEAVPSREDVDSADEMPPPPPPKSLLPTTKSVPKPTTIRGPKKLVKPTSNDTLPKVKAPQKIMVNLNPSRYGQAPPPAARPAPVASNKALPSAPQSFSKSTIKSVQPPSRPASVLSTKNVVPAKSAPSTIKAAAPRVGRPQPQALEKLKAQAPPPRADLGNARPMSRLQTVQDANRVNVPPVNPAKPAKRPFQVENEETIYRPAKRPSQQAKMNPITPAHSQFAKGKIPFAESARASQAQPSQPSGQYSSNGEDIKLPEIMTDSEDEDSDNEFEQPSWVNTPNLREMLSTQQLMDPEAIFGPIAPLNMEQVFPNKERHKRFRERTSSAYWVHDQVTDEEKRKEREARERLVREGAWTYNPSPRPARPGPAR